MIRNIQTYISTHRTVSISDLALHFHVDEQAIQPMMLKLVRKGRVRQLSVPKTCGSCSCCSDSSLQLYEWIKT
jgi:predicted ArsR family transcriptional regulator